MAKTSGPLLSISARGTIAKTQTYSTWKGIPYVRRHVIPANPKTVGQMSTRNTLAFLHDLDKSFGPLMRGIMDAFVRGKALTTHNVFIMWNLSRLRPLTNMDTLVYSDSVNAGFPAATFTVTPGATDITITATPPALPPGWTTTKLIGVATENKDPHGETTDTVHEGEDDTTPYSVVLNGLVTGTLYVAGGLFQYTKPDGTVAYGKSFQANATPT